MAIVGRVFKLGARKSRQSGFHHRQFADARIIVRQLRVAHLAKAGTPRPFARAHMPTAAGAVQQRLTQPPRKIGIECGNRRKNKRAGFKTDKL